MLGIFSGAYLEGPTTSVEVGLVPFTRVFGRLNKAIRYGFVIFIILFLVKFGRVSLLNCLI